MSRGISRGKQVIKSAHTRNHDRICLILTTENEELRMQLLTKDFFTAKNCMIKNLLKLEL